VPIRKIATLLLLPILKNKMINREMVKSDSCDASKVAYDNTIKDASNALLTYASCNSADAINYPMEKTVQSVINPIQQRTITLVPIIQSINNQNTTYTALVTSTKALIAATQPLTDYKTILQGQLDATLQQNTSLQQQIASNANTTMASMALIPDLSKGGPFGTSNVQQGIMYSFLTFYSLFFILLSVVIYLKFKNSLPSSMLITGILVLLGTAGVGAYFCAVYSLFLFDVQSLITTITV